MLAGIRSNHHCPMSLRIAAFLAAIVLVPGIRAANAPLPPEIEDTRCLGINKEPFHATLMPYGDIKEALRAERHKSSLCRSLNGMWKFNYVPVPEQRPVDFHQPSFDVSGWKEIPVPSNWQVLGYGTPYYKNNGYTIQRDFPHVMSEPPRNYTAYEERNPVGSYRRDFEVPAAWNGRRVFLTFDGVDSAFFLWINGEKVGYSVNSRNAAEFDVTRFVKPGKNMVAVEVYRYSSGTWLEDQDMWRLSGIFRNVTVWSAPQVHVRDFSIRTDLDNQYRNATLEVAAKVKNYSDKPSSGPMRLEARLYDKSGTTGNSCQTTIPVPALKPGEEVTIKGRFSVENPKKWTAETPELYTVVLGLSGSSNDSAAGAVAKGGELISTRVGFRKVEIDGRVFKVNGVPIKMYGVNRHEHWPDVGHAVTEAQMIRDIELIKQGNSNHVRTCHYSDDPRWYELCDEYGLWLCAEANCECHGYDRRFDDEPLMREAIIDRNRANTENFKNHASVVMWSLGNECGGRGSNFIAAMDEVKSIDPTRPVHYERFGSGPGNPADFDGKMYGTPKDFAGVATNPNNTKPFYICEYAHAMFNSMGGIADYIEEFDKHPEICGAAIWEWQDQGLYNRRDPKHPIIAYGGGFGEVPNDHYFIHKGVVASDRSPKPHYPEMKRAYQRIKVESADPAVRAVKVRNLYSFIDLGGFSAAWNLTENGKVIQQGKLALPPVKPGAEATLEVRRAAFTPKPGAAYFLNVVFSLNHAELWAPKGFELAAAQFELPAVPPMPRLLPPDTKNLAVNETAGSVEVAGKGFKVVLDKSTGTLSAVESGGTNLLRPNGGPRLHLWRAQHRNDDGWAAGAWSGNGFKDLQFTPQVVKATRGAGGEVRIETIVQAAGKGGFKAVHSANYTVYGDGTVAVDNAVGFNKRVVPARIGVRFLLDPRLAEMTWLGRGPMENYSDRKTGSDMGRYSVTVGKEYNYEKPMDQGNHEDTRWIALAGKGLSGLRVQAESAPFQFTALPWTDEQMENVEYRIDLPPSEATVLTVSAKTLGVGSNGCGPRPLDVYQVHTDPTVFSYVLHLQPSGVDPVPASLPPARPMPVAQQPEQVHGKWKIVSCTSFEQGEGEPANLIDGDSGSYWHSRWSKDATKNPHEIVIDFGGNQAFKGIAYWPRTGENGENGRVKDCEVYTSEDGRTWSAPVTASFKGNDRRQDVMLPAPVKARYLKFVVKSEIHGNNFASIAELDLVQ